jgi:hypothetical protein
LTNSDDYFTNVPYLLTLQQLKKHQEKKAAIGYFALAMLLCVVVGTAVLEMLKFI